MLVAASDPAAGVGFLTAFGAGFISFLSPCVLPLVPGYLATVSGVNVADLDRADWRRVVIPSLIFIASFSTIFILLGLSATSLGNTLTEHRDTLTDLAGILMILMGVLFVASTFVLRLNREWHVDALLRRAGTGGPIVAGAAFAVAWTPCLGPTLGAILTAASTSSSVGHGGVLLAFYSLGLAVPFLLCAIAFDRASIAFRWLRDRYLWVTAISGVILIVMGVLVFTGEMTRLNAEAQKFLNDVGLDFIYSI